MRKLALSAVAGEYAICQADAAVEVDPALLSSAFCSVSRTEEELSIVCRAADAPAHMRVDAGWRLVRLDGSFALSDVGVLASILSPLADAGISVFAISTFNTDYILLQAAGFHRALRVLEGAGHAVNRA
jgi:hypothetical protein